MSEIKPVFINKSELTIAFDAAIQKVKSKADALEPLNFNKGFESIIMAAIAITANHLAKNSALRHEELVARIAELEKTPFAYEGVHESGKAYRRGQFVTYSGAVWHCKEATTQRPGDGNSWQLACKAGRDGKDMR